MPTTTVRFICMFYVNRPRLRNSCVQAKSSQTIAHIRLSYRNAKSLSQHRHALAR